MILMVLFISSCTKVVNNGNVSPSSKAYVLYYDMSSGLPNSVVTIASDNSNYLSNPPDTVYHAITSGTANLYIESFNTGTIINSNTINLTGSSYYTALIYHQATGIPGISAITDDLSSPAAGYCKMRILYTLGSNTLINSPTKISIVNEQTQDSIVNYNRTDLDFFRIQPLINFTSIKAGTFSLYVNNSIITSGLPFNSYGKIFTVIVTQVPNLNGIPGFVVNYFANK